MSNGLQAPCFEFIADALLEQLRHEASCQAIVEPFMRDMPAMAVNTLGAFQKLQRRLVLMAEAERLIRAMVPFEDAVRNLTGLPGGPRKVS